jgi:hypothetical protein
MNEICVCVYVCVCITFCGGNDDSNNIIILQLTIIQTISGVNQRTCKQIFKHYNIQHINSGFFISIYTASDMLH